MSEQLTLSAGTRERAGKGASRSLRREGRVPAVVYGNNEDPLAIHLEEKLLVKALSTGHFMNSVVMIDAGGAPVRTLPKDVQFHPVSDRPLHVDFLRISEHAKVSVAVPIRFIDEEESKGLKRGGVLNAVRHDLELVCDASEIPEQIEISLAGLDIGDSLHISQVKLPGRHRKRDHRPRLHHRHHRLAVGLQGRGRGCGRGRGRPSRSWRPARCRWSARTKPRPRAARNRLLSRFSWLGTLFGSRRAEVPGQPASAPEVDGLGEFAPVQIWVGLGNPGASYAMQRHNVGFMAADAIAETHGFDPPKKAFSGWAQQGRIGGAAHPDPEARHLHERQRPRGARGDGLLQEGGRATSPSSTTSSISPRSRSR